MIPAVARRLTLSIAALALALAGQTATAGAALFPADAIDGPSADIKALGEVDLARDATGGVVYVKADGGVDHVFVSRFRQGSWATPERIDGPLPGSSSAPVIAASNEGRLAVAFVNSGHLYVATKPTGADPWSAPAPLYSDAEVSNPAIDMSINGVAYAVFSAGNDVRAARLSENSWSMLPGTLDIDAAQTAGTGAGRPKVAVSADNNAVAVWGESGADGRRHVFARRLTELVPSAAPQEVSVPDLEGHAGGDADSPDIDIEDDNSYAWVVFRESFADTDGVARSRTLARRLVGSLFDPAGAVDGLAFPIAGGARDPRIDMTGRGEALIASGRDGTGDVWGDVLNFDKLGSPLQISTASSASAPHPVPATGEQRDGVFAWQRDAGGGVREIVARSFTTDPKDDFEAPVVVSRPEWGASDAAAGWLDASADRSGNSAIVFIQGTGADTRLVAAELDRTPGRPGGLNTMRFIKASRPTLRWHESADTWGPITYHVLIDGVDIGSSTGASLVPATPLLDGLHRWNIVATDRRGQTATSRTRQLRIDATPPAIEISVTGTRKRGKGLRFRIVASDGVSRSKASGTKSVLIKFGDGASTTQRRAVHRYRSRGSYTVRVSASDKAGNVAVERMRLRIRK